MIKKQKIRITKEFKFEMAHALSCHTGPCKNIHGHSYILSVTVSGYPIDDESRPDHGMILDFGDLKAIVKGQIISVFDHALVLHKDTNETLKSELNKNFPQTLWVNYHPTSENLLLDFVNRLQPKLPPFVFLHSMKLRETVTSFAEWYASDNK